MNKMMSALFASALLSLSLSADTLRIEAGGGAWNQKNSGTISYETSTEAGNDTSTEKENTVGYAWIYLKHPIPILPNVRLEYAKVQYEGVDTVTKPLSVPLTTSTFDANVYDGILYYNILDNTAWMTLDLGLDVRMFDFDYEVAPTTGYAGYSKSGTLVVPMAYLRARFEVPGTGIGFEGQGSYITYDGATYYDARAKIDWTMEFIPVVQPGIEVGYRIMKADYKKDGSEINADIDFSGVYAGAMVRF